MEVGRGDRAPNSSASEDEQRLFNKAVLVGSVAPRSAAWLFRSGWREAPLGTRLVACLSVALALAFTGFVAWAIFSGRGVLAAYGLLGLLGVSVGASLLLQAVLLVPAARRRLNKQGE